MPELLKIAAGLTHPISLAAFAVAIILLVLRLKKKIPYQFWTVIPLLVIAPIVVSALLEIQKSKGESEIERERLSANIRVSKEQSIYRVRVTVLDVQHVPVEDARVWSSLGGEPKKVAAGWEFDIPNASKPKGGKLTVYASLPNKFLHGRQELVLSDDYHPGVRIQLTSENSALVRGIIVDEGGNAILGARVSVVGYESEGLITGESGSFVLPAHAAPNQQVLLHAEKRGFSALQQWHPAGSFPATMTLEKR